MTNPSTVRCPNVGELVYFLYAQNMLTGQPVWELGRVERYQCRCNEPHEPAFIVRSLRVADDSRRYSVKLHGVSWREPGLLEKLADV